MLCFFNTACLNLRRKCYAHRPFHRVTTAARALFTRINAVVRKINAGRPSCRLNKRLLLVIVLGRRDPTRPATLPAVVQQFLARLRLAKAQNGAFAPARYVAGDLLRLCLR